MAEQKKTNAFWKYSFFIILAAFIVGAFVFFSANKGSTDGIKRVNVGTGNDAILGNESATVTIIEFSDYQCIFCRKFWTETYPQLKKDYIDTGRVKFVFRDFPIEQIHPASVLAAESTRCIRAQYGDAAYWKMSDKIFSAQDETDPSVSRTLSFGIYDIEGWANQIGYDISACLKNETYKADVTSDLVAGQAAGVKGTPSFFVNGKFLEGAQPYSVFKQAIDSEP